MNDLVLITGGAGFIGSEVARTLLCQGYRVRIIDNFSSQIHSNHFLPIDIAGNVELIDADICDPILLANSLDDVRAVVHLAAETGTGQSMYRIENYFKVNVQGTALLLDLLMQGFGKQLETIIVASSRAIYGEGAYTCKEHGLVFPSHRTIISMTARQFEPICPKCKGSILPTPTPESCSLSPASFYAITKQVQEQAVLLFAKNRGINAFALRYQNVYGPGQSLINPYTGILSIFSNLARQNKKIEVYEDGMETRDFVYISDVVDATVNCISHSKNFIGALNIGSGEATSVLHVAKSVCKYLSSKSQIEINGIFRVGDIRHNIANLDRVKSLINYFPSVPFEVGLHRFLDWALSQEIINKGGYLESKEELLSRNLILASLRQ
jgi:dTDP-L-rhamnose 4-epimerase